MVKQKLVGLTILAVAFLALTSTSALATSIDFENLTGPSVFASSTPQSPSYSVGGVNVTFTGGTILTNTTYLPADETTVYGTADFAPGPLQNPLTITFDQNISNFFLDVLNGENFDVTYTVADNAGHSASFTLAPNLSSGQTTTGFAATGTVVTVTASRAPSPWDFFIDSVRFDDPLPAGAGVPEPSTLLLLGSGFVGLGGFAWRRNRKS